MKTQVRQGVFETNSSSSHSITICEEKDALYDTIVPDPDGSITIDMRGYEFGWQEGEEYHDPYSKIVYCLLDIDAAVSDDLVKLNLLSMLHNVILNHTGAKSIKQIDTSQGYESSYIDHQSYGTAVNGGAFESEETLKNFIFNSKSFVMTDNDNH